MPTEGLGAWSYGPYHRDMDVPDARVAAGIRAFKQELIYCKDQYGRSFGAGIKVDLPIFGNSMEARVKDFQNFAGLEPDGRIWSDDARALFRQRSNEIHNKYRIPFSYLAKIKTLESNNDPVAEGRVDENDEGIMQLHLDYWPGWTEAMAWNPPEAMDASGLKMKSAKQVTTSWEGAVAAHNIGVPYAKQWVAAGYPVEGGPQMGEDDKGNPVYAFPRATHYLALVKSVRL